MTVVEIIAADVDAQFYIRVKCQDTAGTRRHNEWQLEVGKRSEVTVDWIEQTLTEWEDQNGEAGSLTSFSIQRIDIAGQGSKTNEDITNSSSRNGQPINPATITSDLSYEPRDRIAYYVDGPGSTVYGYTTDAIVTDLPPIHKQHREPILGKVEMDTGVDTKLIPTDWVVGPATDVDIDRSNEKI